MGGGGDDEMGGEGVEDGAMPTAAVRRVKKNGRRIERVAADSGRRGEADTRGTTHQHFVLLSFFLGVLGKCTCVATGSKIIITLQCTKQSTRC
jgi:hypothetical protein